MFSFQMLSGTTSLSFTDAENAVAGKYVFPGGRGKGTWHTYGQGSAEFGISD